MADAAALVERVLGRVVGREREVELVVAALAADRHVLLEGPPGTGKSTLLRAVADELGFGFEFVEGNAELTPVPVCHFDPAGCWPRYTPLFVDGRGCRLRVLSLYRGDNRIPGNAERTSR